MIVQIYAFTNIEDALAAVKHGVNHIGFIAGTYGQVHAELSFDQCARLVDALPSEVRSSALTMATDVEEISRMAAQVKPDIVHISTDTWQVDPTAMSQLRRELAGEVQLMKAIAVGGKESLEAAEAFDPVSDYLLLDTKVHDLPGVGATGRIHDWDISAQIVEQSPIPVILAGGLTPENVAAAIQRVQPEGVDSNTGTNLAGDPVKKDMDKVAKFAQAALAGSGIGS
jgi:phosphoribosylanthranilate isomerase